MLLVPIRNNPDENAATASISPGNLCFISFVLIGNNYILTQMNLDTGKITQTIVLTSRGEFAKAGFLMEDTNIFVPMNYDQSEIFVVNLKNQTVFETPTFTYFNFQAVLYKSSFIGMEIVGGVFQSAKLLVQSVNVFSGEKNWKTVFNNVSDTFIYSITIDSSGNIYFLHQPDSSESEQNVIVKINAETGEFKLIDIPFQVTQSISDVRVAISNIKEPNKHQLYFFSSLKENDSDSHYLLSFDVETDKFMWKYPLLGNYMGDIRISSDGSILTFLTLNYTKGEKSKSFLYSISNEGKKLLELELPYFGCQNVNILPNRKLVLTCTNSSTIASYVLDSNGKQLEYWVVQGEYPFDPVFDSANNMFYCVTNSVSIVAVSSCTKKSLA